MVPACRPCAGARPRAQHLSCAASGVHLDEGRLVGDRLGGLDGLADALQVGVAVLDVLHVPAERLEACGHVLGERDLGVAVDGDPVVVVQRDQLAQAPVPRQRARLVGDALHVAAIAQDAIPAARCPSQPLALSAVHTARVRLAPAPLAPGCNRASICSFCSAPRAAGARRISGRACVVLVPVRLSLQLVCLRYRKLRSARCLFTC